MGTLCCRGNIKKEAFPVSNYFCKNLWYPFYLFLSGSSFFRLESFSFYNTVIPVVLH